MTNSIKRISTKVDVDRKDEVAGSRMGVFLRFEIRNTLAKYQQLIRDIENYKNSVSYLIETSNNLITSLNELSHCGGIGSSNAIAFQSCANVIERNMKLDKNIINVLTKDVELPLTKNLDSHTQTILDSEKRNGEILRKLSDEIKSLNKKCDKAAKKKSLNYPAMVKELSFKEGELERSKNVYYNEGVDEERRNASFILQKISVFLKHQAKVFSEKESNVLNEIEGIINAVYAPDASIPLPKNLMDNIMSYVPSRPISIKFESEKSLNDKNLIINSESPSISTGKVNGLLDANIHANEGGRFATSDNLTNQNPLDNTIVIYDFVSRRPREMTIKKRVEKNWLFAENEKGETGWVPKNHVGSI
ncbi:hypothetical protein ROZALSC1DRAFT_27904 [Rozella allomycis CSF55]|uniref:SH3 domain-containing protein n=1 Tax=Rozella allomycis (strain CSF55) TaxID=988480 RepID=A0A4P9YM74_ROZAC|nr:hypothetical protein ROZALSC1DRAFT_27904 [Rozella allomycis CSF55]